MVSDPGPGRPSEVVHSLGIRVIRGDYVPGSLIDPDSPGDDLGASQTVVRERAAWQLLDADVMSWRCEAETPCDALLTGLAELRRTVEPAGVRLAAHRRTEDDRRDLGEALDPVPDHRAIFEAVRDGRGDAARAAVTHLLASSEDLGSSGEDVRPRTPG